MATKEDVQKLAVLARITIAEEDLGAFTKEFDAILAYVSQLEAFNPTQDFSGEKPHLRNVMREDGDPHVPGAYTEKLAQQFPSREGDALVVKQIVTHE